MTHSQSVGRPWYQNFWPWFIVGLLGVTVVGSLTTVYIAFLYGDEEIPRASVSVEAPERVSESR